MMPNNKEVGQSMETNQSVMGHKQVYKSATRNQGPILEVLRRFLSAPHKSEESPLFLEISSGSGQHVAHFAPNFPHITFQPSEIDTGLFESITSYGQTCPTANVKKPVCIDIRKKLNTYGFKYNSIDYIYNANMMHISPFEATIGLFENAGSYLKTEGLLITYGPYSENGVLTPESNVIFNAHLQSNCNLWGIRDINDLVSLGDKNNLSLKEKISMPSNNFILVWKKKK